MRINQRFLNVTLTMVAAIFCVDAALIAQSEAINLVNGSPVRGTIQTFTAEKIVVSTNDGNKDVFPWNVRSIRYSGQNDLMRAITAFNDERFKACFDRIESITEAPSRPLIKHELDFYKAMSAAKIALQGGSVTSDSAARLVSEFMKTHPQSFRTYEILDTFGDLALFGGRLDAAIKQYEKTANGSWPKYRFLAKLKIGKAKLYAGDFPGAIEAFREAEKSENTDDSAQQIKLIAKCLQAQALGMSGDVEGGKRLALSVIKNESSKNVELYAYAYNALGACHQQAGETKQAIRAYLRTDLLFNLNPESHSEALFQLGKLWETAERTDRANRARQKLSELYRNTYWALKQTRG